MKDDRIFGRISFGSLDVEKLTSRSFNIFNILAISIVLVAWVCGRGLFVGCGSWVSEV